MNGAELLVDTLVRAGVRRIFSLSGNQIMPVYDACIDARLSIVHVRHESAAVHMADAWAQITGEIGVALVTAGPGFGNALSALFSARHAESPVLLLSGDSPVASDGNSPFQEMPQTEIARPLVKTTLRPDRASIVGRATASAIACARSGRPGPVHVALPFDVLGASAEEGCRVETAELDRRPRELPGPIAGEIAERIARASRPVVLTGPRLNRSREPTRVAALESELRAPVVAMESPRGLRDPALGAFSRVLAAADLVVLLGKGIDYSVGFARPPAMDAAADVIVVDPDAMVADRANRLAGDRLVLSARADADLAADAIARAGRGSSRHDWYEEVTAAIADRTLAGESNVGFHPRVLCSAVQRVLDAAADPVLVCDGGEFGQWAQASCTAVTRIINGLSGAIGGGLCHALAAKLARPQATVIAMMGDGTAGFHFTELDTAVREGAAFVTVIGNDFRWNAEHQIQLRNYGPERLIGCDLAPSARYDLAAAGLGCHGEHVTHPGGLDDALNRALASGVASCLNVEIDGVAAPDHSGADGGAGH